MKGFDQDQGQEKSGPAHLKTQQHHLEDSAEARKVEHPLHRSTEHRYLK